MTAPRRSAATASIRPASSADVAAIERLLVASKLPIDGVAEIVSRTSSDFIVAEAAGVSPRVVGVAGLEVCGDAALLRSVAVDDAWRSHGLGQQLVERLIADADSRGLAALYLLTTTADGYFPRFGFAVVDRAAVPPAVAGTVEFTAACPASAIAMARRTRVRATRE